jgi:hypothetical protein
MSPKRAYVGVSRENCRSRQVFLSSTVPAEDAYPQLATVIGPFRTRCAANFSAMHGYDNPHCRSVADAERLAHRARNYAFLSFASDPIARPLKCRSKRAAIDAFATTARDLARYEQQINGHITFARSVEELPDTPDLTLSLGPRGGIRIQRIT